MQMLQGMGNLTFDGPAAHAGFIPAGWDISTLAGYFILFVALWSVLYAGIVQWGE